MPEDNRKITEIMRKVQEGREEKKFLSTKATFRWLWCSKN